MKYQNNYSNLKFPSLYIDKEIGIEAHIAELLIYNKIKYRQKQGRKIAHPKCAFWQKDVAAQDSFFQELQKDYTLELINAKKLLNCFSPRVILDYIRERNLSTIGYLKLDPKKTVIYHLFDREQKYIKELREESKKHNKEKKRDVPSANTDNNPNVEAVEPSRKENNSMANKISDLLN